ncbi:MAG: hypothetical protein U9Q81_01820 [Pseudomonadota bacterium]|nr:hypothetical protein [Pseudomonadota bacterium]
MNKKGAFFKEEQRFTQWWLWLILVPIIVGAVIFMVASTYQQLILGEPFGDRPMSNLGLVVANLFTLLVGVGLPVAILTTKLAVFVERTQLRVKFSYLANKRVPVSEIASFRVVNYSPIREYGGWGVRYSLKGKRWAYNVKGNIGVEIDLADGRKWLIGSQRPEELAEAIAKAKKE